MSVKNLLGFLLLLAGIGVTESKAQTYCTPTGLYCGADDYINAFSTTGGATNISNTASGCSSTGYTFYNTMTFTGVQNTTFGFSGTVGPYPSLEIINIWVDWNQDGDFVDAGENIYTSSGLAGAYAAYSGTATIPAGALPGTTRMRVMCTYSSAGSPCNTTPAFDGEAEDYNFVVVASAPCTGTPTAGTAVASPAAPCLGSSSTVSLSGASLTSGISYQWQTRPNATAPWTTISGATASNYSIASVTTSAQYRAYLKCSASPATADTSTPVTVAPFSPNPASYTETFESIVNPGQLPNCMVATPFGQYTGAYTSTGATGGSNHTPGGTKNGYFYYASTSNAFITPAFNLVGGKTYQFSFWYLSSTSGTNWTDVSVKFGATNTIAGLTNLAGSVTPAPVNSTVWKKYSVNVMPTTSGVYYIGIVASQGGTYTGTPYLSIDDLGMIELLPCAGVPNAGAPIATDVNPCPGNIITLYDTLVTQASGITMSWQDSSAAHGWQNVAATPNNGATSAYFTSPPINDTTFYRMWIKCNNTNDTAVSVSIRIDPKYTRLPYYETFESITTNNQFPNCMTPLTVSAQVTAGTYTANQTTFNRTNHTTLGSKFAYLNGSISPTLAGLFTPGLKLEAGKTYELSYWYRTGVSGGGGATDIQTLRSYYSSVPATSGLLTTNQIGVTITNPNNTAYKQFVDIFTPTQSGTYYIGIIITHTSYGASSLTVDDIGLVELPPCTGTPNAGGVPVAQLPTPCPGGITDIIPDTSAGVTYASNIRYQWQDSSAAHGWQNVPAGGANDTLRRYTTYPINDTTWFRVVMTCKNTPGPNNVSISGRVRVSPNFPTIPYLETFEGITANNTLPPCMSATDLGGGVLSYTSNQGSGNRTNHTAGGSKYVSISGGFGTTDALYTPGFNLIAGKTYEFSFWYITGSSTTAPPANFTTLEVRAGTTPSWTTMSVQGSVRPSPISNTTYQRFAATFKPTTTGVYYFGVSSARTLVSGNYLSIDDIGVNVLPECTGAPTAGTTTPATTTVCPGAYTDLTLNGDVVSGGLTYQWQESTDGTTWASVATGGFGETTRYYETHPINQVTQFRALITCNNGGATSTSVPATVTPSFPTLPYLETFEGITSNDQLPGCMSATNLGSGVRTYTANQTSGNRTNHTAGGSKFASFFTGTAGDNYLYTPGMNMVGGKTYKFTFWYITGNSGTGAPINVTSVSAWYGSLPTPAGMTNPIGAVQSSPVMNTTYQQFQETFSPATSGVYYVGIKTSATAATAYVSVDDIGLDTLSSCTGNPVAGAVVPVTPCPNVAFTLRASGGTSRFAVAGLTFQWKDSSSVNQSWQNSAGVTATTSDYTTSISVPTRYRLIVTCTATGAKDSTADILINLAPFYQCYCTPTYATGASNNGITKVQLVTLNNSSSVAYPWYTDYTPQQPTPLPVPLLTMTRTDTLYVTMGSYSGNYTGVWIDMNHNSIFDASEYFTDGISVGPSGVAKIAITPPATAQFGLTRMRIRSGDRAAVTQGMACGPTGSAYGEAEDYYVTLQYPPCAGPVNAGDARTSDLTTCAGYSVDLVDSNHEQRMSGTSWSWQISEDGGLSWDAVPNSAGKDTLNNVLITRAVSYRLRMFCANTGDSTFSTPASIGIKPAYACYCVSQSTGTPNDYSDIGAVQIGNMVNSTGGPHILNPSATRRHSFYTEIPNIEMNADGSYRLSIYHIQRNGVHENARVSVFVDYNNNLIYEAGATPNSERVFTGLTSAGNFYIDTVIHVPNAVIPETPTGLRVILNSDLDPNAPANLGCGEYLSGETEDYVVKFHRAVPGGIGSVGGNVQNVSLYPNPTTGRFTVSASGQQSLGVVEVQVSTITGQTVIQHSYDNVGSKFSAEVDLGDHARGIYFVEIRTGGQKIIRKISLR